LPYLPATVSSSHSQGAECKTYMANSYKYINTSFLLRIQ